VTLLKKINELKDNLSEIEEGTTDLPKEVRHGVQDSLKECRQALNRAGVLIEKYYTQDALTLDIKKDLLDRMNKEEIYQGVPIEKRQKMIDKIIGSKSHTLMKEQELKEYIKKTLKLLPPEDLVKKAYLKEELIKLGEMLLGEKAKNASEYVKYNEGLDLAVGSQSKFSNKQDTQEKALARIEKTPSLRTSYLYAYYGV